MDVFHEARQRHVEGVCELADRGLAGAQPHHDRPPRRIGERCENLIELG